MLSGSLSVYFLRSKSTEITFAFHLFCIHKIFYQSRTRVDIKLHWIEYFLEIRTQYNVICGIHSSLAKITSDFSRGTVLGHLI